MIETERKINRQHCCTDCRRSALNRQPRRDTKTATVVWGRHLRESLEQVLDSRLVQIEGSNEKERFRLFVYFVTMSASDRIPRAKHNRLAS